MWSTPRFVALLVLAAVGPSSVAADNPHPLAPENADLLRVKYLGSPNLPDGVAFFEILRFLDSLVPRERDVAVSLVQQEMGLLAPEANEFVDKMVATYGELLREIDQAQHALACTGNSPAFHGEAVYQILEAMEDRVDQVSESRMTAVLRSLSAENAAKFRQWIDVQKLNINHVKFKKKETYQRRGGRSADAVLAALCLNLAERLEQ